MAGKPMMSPYARHLFICTGQFCDPEGLSRALYAKLPELLGKDGDYRNPCRVKRGTSSCLGVCAGGPLVVVYPDGVWYHGVDERVLRRIIDEHLRENRPVEEHIFHDINAACIEENER